MICMKSAGGGREEQRKTWYSLCLGYISHSQIKYVY